MKKFIHLHVHSHFSISSGLNDIASIVEKAAAQKFHSIALTDTSNLFAMVKFYEEAVRVGIKPILGCCLYLADQREEALQEIIILAKNKTGLQFLMQLISRAYEHEDRLDMPFIKSDWLVEKNSSNLIGIYCYKNFLSEEITNHSRFNIIQKLAGLFVDSFYLELCFFSFESDNYLLHNIAQLAQQFSIPLVATNAVYFINENEYEAHDARNCIARSEYLSDKKRVSQFNRAQYLKSNQTMLDLFQDYPSAIINSEEIAQRCNVKLELAKTYLPNYPVPKTTNSKLYLEKLAFKGLEKRLSKFEDKEQAQYKKRLKKELNVINTMNYAGYFLIVADFIQWAKKKAILVGPGRGSGAGSLVAYALSITDLDPIEYQLLFERFLNPERVSMPDFDIDFCMEKRDRVIDYVANKYGKRSVSQIITFGTMAAKAVIRDVGRVLGMPYGFVDSIAKLIPNELGITLKKALDQEPVLYEKYREDEEVTNLINLALQLEGKVRNAGKHAGGVVISPSLLTDFTPFYCEPKGINLVSQLDKDDVEKIGLVKFDFLGLRTLTIIDWACEHILRLHNLKLDIAEIKLNCLKTFSLIKAGKTSAIFQLESRGMKELIRRLQPNSFEEIIALVALFRPGPLQSGMVDDFINRKHGREKIEYPHACLAEILSPTYGVILYQEQVMQIAQVLSNYTLGGADILRRAMGKKKPEEMEKQRSIFVKGAEKNGVSTGIATNIFNLIEKFAGYGFNKSHSAAYALISYQTAWLKTHYSTEFMSASISSDMDNTAKVVHLIEECQTMKLSVIPPCVNQSDYKFLPLNKNQIQFGLGAIKGVGEAAIESMLDSKKTQGEFNSFWDFCTRIDLRKVNKRVFEALIKSGSFDSFHYTRKFLLSRLEEILKHVLQINQHLGQGQVDFFSSLEQPSLFSEAKNNDELDSLTLLKGEKETLGYYLSGHPYDSYREEMASFISGSIKTLQLVKGQSYKIAGIIQNLRRIKTKSGQFMAVVVLDDGTKRLELALFPSVYEAASKKLLIDHVLFVCAEAVFDRYRGKLSLQTKNIFTLEETRLRFLKKIVLEVGDEQLNQGSIINLKNCLENAEEGVCVFNIVYVNAQYKAKVLFKQFHKRLLPTEQLLLAIKASIPTATLKLQN